MVGLLWLAHEEACETELAALIADNLATGHLPGVKDLKPRVAPRRRPLPDDVLVTLTELATFDGLFEMRSLAIAANQPFSAWDTVFLDQAVTVAAIDRLVNHATILEMKPYSYRRRAAAGRTALKADAAATTSADSLAGQLADTLKEDFKA